MFNDAMSQLMQLRGCPSRIIHGDCRGADWLARDWAKRLAIGCIAVEADWATHGPKAGPIRNQMMLDTFTPSIVIAFPGGKGTKDIVRRARKIKGVDVVEIKPTALDTERTEQTARSNEKEG